MELQYCLEPKTIGIYIEIMASLGNVCTQSTGDTQYHCNHVPICGRLWSAITVELYDLPNCQYDFVQRPPNVLEH